MLFTPERPEYMAYPRVCALAEIGWTPLNPDVAKQKRGGEAGMLLRDELEAKLPEFNPWLSGDAVRSIIETPVRASELRPIRVLYVASAHAITASTGSASYGNQRAAAAAEGVNVQDVRSQSLIPPRRPARLSTRLTSAGSSMVRREEFPPPMKRWSKNTRALKVSTASSRLRTEEPGFAAAAGSRKHAP